MDESTLGPGYSFRASYMNAKPKRKENLQQILHLDANQEARVGLPWWRSGWESAC